ncbi:cupin domain-containing protein [Chryseobacterium limigenitum]|uniref:AraC-like ligand binding domain-containing protein n=1 Tax=Chryseobacterium limigenitum TaxID=1612149 RepID=A0A1K2ID01_9FLAO|nr:AraC family ligand binding domain-containing protein [Chryseobacterium limigenitum]SFZ90301.1 AraC-like ligand binding domain-containing protein [Chryseobacterium limigenitum]
MSIERINHFKEDKQCDFFINYYKNNFPYGNKPHRHEYYQIILITDGYGEHTVEEHTFSVQSGNLFILTDNQLHNFKNLTATSGFIIGFDYCFFTNLMKINNYKFNLFNPIFSISNLLISGDNTGLHQSFTNLYKEYLHENYFSKQEVLQYLLQIILIKNSEFSK